MNHFFSATSYTGLKTKTNIARAMKMWEDTTCLRFRRNNPYVRTEVGHSSVVNILFGNTYVSLLMWFHTVNGNKNQYRVIPFPNNYPCQCLNNSKNITVKTQVIVPGTGLIFNKSDVNAKYFIFFGYYIVVNYSKINHCFISFYVMECVMCNV